MRLLLSESGVSNEHAYSIGSPWNWLGLPCRVWKTQCSVSGTNNVFIHFVAWFLPSGRAILEQPNKFPGSNLVCVARSSSIISPPLPFRRVFLSQLQPAGKKAGRICLLSIWRAVLNQKSVRDSKTPDVASGRKRLEKNLLFHDQVFSPKRRSSPGVEAVRNFKIFAWVALLTSSNISFDHSSLRKKEITAEAVCVRVHHGVHTEIG